MSILTKAFSQLREMLVISAMCELEWQAAKERAFSQRTAASAPGRRLLDDLNTSVGCVEKLLEHSAKDRR